MRPLAFLAVLLVAALPLLTAAAPWTPLTFGTLKARPHPRVNATISYGPDAMQRIDVWVPKGKGPFPIVLMVHGGCWTSEVADRSLMDWIAADLRKAGYAVWNIDYRGVDRKGGGYPGTFADAAKAADLLPVYAAKYQLDTHRILAVGHSAGGHLALWLAGRPKLSASSQLFKRHPLPIAHVVSLGGLPDLEATAASPDNGCGTAVVGKLVGPTAPAHPDPYADTSVTRLLPLGVPQDLVNGREDHIIPLRLGTGYVAKAKAAGDRASLHVIDHTDHFELIAPETPAWAEAKRLIAAAFAK